MKRYEGLRYASKWDLSTWSMIALTFVCCLLPFFLNDDGYMPIVVGVTVLLSMIVILKSVYYRIEGDELIVYQVFIPRAYPIGKISEVYSVKSYFSAPATSLTDRIAIKFTDRKIMKSVMPLVISPANKEGFIEELLKINPDIKVDIG